MATKRKKRKSGPTGSTAKKSVTPKKKVNTYNKSMAQIRADKAAAASKVKRVPMKGSAWAPIRAKQAAANTSPKRVPMKGSVRPKK
jgi:hypothetical protein